MPKMKSHRGAAKRFRVTKNGKVKRNKPYKSHILTKKDSKRKRGLRQATLVASTVEKKIKNMILG